MKTVAFFLTLLIVSCTTWGQKIIIKNESSVEIHYSLPSADGPKMDVFFTDEVKSFELVDFPKYFGAKAPLKGFMCRFLFEDQKGNTYIFYKVLNHGETFVITNEVLANYFGFAQPSKNGYRVNKDGSVAKRNDYLAKR